MATARAYYKSIIRDVAEDILYEKSGKEIIELLEDDYNFELESIAHDLIKTSIDRNNIYTRDSKDIVEAFEFDVFEVNEYFDSRPNSWREAGIMAMESSILYGDYEHGFWLADIQKRLEEHVEENCLRNKKED